VLSKARTPLKLPPLLVAAPPGVTSWAKMGEVFPATSALLAVKVEPSARVPIRFATPRLLRVRVW